MRKSIALVFMISVSQIILSPKPTNAMNSSKFMPVATHITFEDHATTKIDISEEENRLAELNDPINEMHKKKTDSMIVPIIVFGGRKYNVQQDFFSEPEIETRSEFKSEKQMIVFGGRKYSDPQFQK